MILVSLISLALLSLVVGILFDTYKRKAKTAIALDPVEAANDAKALADAKKEVEDLLGNLNLAIETKTPIDVVETKQKINLVNLRLEAQKAFDAERNTYAEIVIRETNKICKKILDCKPDNIQVIYTKDNTFNDMYWLPSIKSAKIVVDDYIFDVGVCEYHMYGGGVTYDARIKFPKTDTQVTQLSDLVKYEHYLVKAK